MVDDGTIPAGKTHHISILLQDREPDAGDLDGKQNTRSDAGDACADDGDLDVWKSYSLQMRMVRRVLGKPTFRLGDSSIGCSPSSNKAFGDPFR